MVSHFGDYDTTETVIIPFNTFTSDDPSASSTITNLAAGDVEIHKDGSATQRSSDNGVTVTIDFDSVTGNHIISIDLSDNSDAGFYAAGSRYQVRMEGTTVDGATINAWVGTFSIGCTLRPTTAGRTLDVTATGAAGIDWGNVENAGTTVDLSATDINLCDTVATNSDMRGTDSALLASSAPTNFGDLAITVTTGQITVGTNNDKTGYSISGTKTTLDALNDVAATDIVSGGAITTSSGAVSNVTLVATTTTNTDMRGTDSSLLASSAPTNFGDLSITATTGRVDVASIEGSDATDQINAACDTALSDYDAPTKTEMDSAFTEIKGATWNSSTDTLEAIRDRGDSSWLTATGFSTHSAADVGALVVEGSVTILQSLQLANAANAGKTNGMATTTANLRDLGDAKNRIQATVDADGNRSAVTVSYD